MLKKFLVTTALGVLLTFTAVPAEAVDTYVGTYNLRGAITEAYANPDFITVQWRHTTKLIAVPCKFVIKNKRTGGVSEKIYIFALRPAGDVLVFIDDLDDSDVREVGTLSKLDYQGQFMFRDIFNFAERYI